MKLNLLDLPENQIAYIGSNCHCEIVEDMEMAEIVISSSEQVIATAIEKCITTIAYQTPGEWKSFPGVDMIVEGFEEVDDRFLQRVYERHHRIPWTILETERLMVRELELSDLDALFELYSYEGMTDYMEGLYPYEEEIAYQKAYVENMYRFYGYGMWLVFEKETGKLVGRAGVEHREALDGQLELGYAIATPHWNKGYATEVCSAIIDYAREELGFDYICSLIEPENKVSCHLAEKLGLIFEQEMVLDGKVYRKYAVLC